MWTFLSRLPFVATLVTFVCIVIMFALGNWQLQRAEQKTARLLAVEQAAQTEQVNLQQVIRSDIDNMLDVPVNFEGSVDSERFFY